MFKKHTKKYKKTDTAVDLLFLVLACFESLLGNNSKTNNQEPQLCPLNGIKHSRKMEREEHTHTSERARAESYLRFALNPFGNDERRGERREMLGLCKP